MLRKLRPRSIYDVFALLALTVAVGGTSAYAANSVFSSDIVDGQVKSVDIGDGEVGSADVKDNSLNTFDVHSFLGVDVVDNTLTGADINEGTLGQVPSAANGARRITYDDPPSADIKTVLTIREMTLKADCSGPPGTAVALAIDSTVPAVVNYGYLRTTSDGMGIQPEFGGTSTPFFGLLAAAISGGVGRAEGQLVYSNANREISITFHAVGNNVTDRCQLNGTAVPAPG